MVKLTASAIDQLKILPRLAFLCQIVLTWKVCLWFMTLPDPTPAQAGLVSVVTGAMTGAFAVWLGHEKEKVS